MPSATVPFSITGQLSAPVDEGQPAIPRAFGISSNFNSESTERLILTGSGTKVVAFGSLGSPGAKGVLIEYIPAAGSLPVLITFNGGTDTLELSPGGFLAYGSPAPAVGITSLSIAFTADCALRVWLAG